MKVVNDFSGVENLPLVSVVMPSRNSHCFMGTAVRSVLAQSYQNIELVIVDDCSDKGICSGQFGDTRIRCIRNDEVLGGAVSRNRGVDHSTGDYVCFLDDDDYYFPEKIEVLIKPLLEDPSLDASFGKTLRASARFLNCSIRGGRLSSLGHVKYLHTNASLIRRDVFLNIRFFEKLKKFQDTQLHYELLRGYRIYFVDEFVSFWRDNYVGTRITDMRTDEKIKNSIESYWLLLEYLRSKGFKDRQLKVLYRGYLRHVAKFLPLSFLAFSQLRVTEKVYVYLCRILYLLKGLL